MAEIADAIRYLATAVSFGALGIILALLGIMSAVRSR